MESTSMRFLGTGLVMIAVGAIIAASGNRLGFGMVAFGWVFGVIGFIRLMRRIRFGPGVYR